MQFESESRDTFRLDSLEQDGPMGLLLHCWYLQGSTQMELVQVWRKMVKNDVELVLYENQGIRGNENINKGNYIKG